MTGAITFVDRAKLYIDYSSDACQNFAEVTAIQVLGHTFGHDLVNLIQPGEVYHNMYVLLMGQSSKTRKTTTQSKFKKIFPQERELPMEGSYEALAEVMSEQNEGFDWMGELSAFLKGAKRGDYRAGFVEFFNGIVDCQKWMRKIRGNKEADGWTIIEKPYLSINSTCTDEVLMENLTYEMAFGGLLARYLIVKGIPHTRPRGRLMEDYFRMHEILKGEVEFMLQLDKTGCAFELSDEALKYYNDVVEKECDEKELEIASIYATRYQNYVVAFADILLVSEALGVVFDSDIDLHSISKLVELIKLVKLVDIESLDGEKLESFVVSKSSKGSNSTNLTYPTRLVVPKRFVEEAWRIIKPCLYSARDLLQYIDMGKNLARVREYIRKNNGNEVSHSDALRRTNVETAKKFEDIIEVLKDRGEITVRLERFTKKNNAVAVRKFYKWNEVPTSYGQNDLIQNKEDVHEPYRSASEKAGVA